MSVEQVVEKPLSGAQSLGDIEGKIASRVLDTIQTGVLVVDSHSNIVHCNSSAVEILRRDRRQLHALRLDAVLASIEDLIEGMHDQRGEYSITLPTGESVTLGYYVSDMENGRFAVVFQNISKWVKLREERDRLLQLATVGELMPMLLHELKNPLAAVSTAVEVLIEEMPAGSVQDDLHAILGEMRRMRLCFDGLGAVGRSVRGKRLAAIDVACHEASLVLRSRAEKTHVTLISELEEMPALPFDPAVIRAIVFNLVVNAIDACDAGGTVLLSAGLVDNGGALKLCVKDTGRGMDEEQKQRCTELFYTTKPRGTGIGLAICARAVQGAGGSVTIDSALGRGTSICVRVPTSIRPST